MSELTPEEKKKIYEEEKERLRVQEELKKETGTKMEKEISDKKRLPAFLLCFFFWFLGAHRFYVGKIGTGIIWFLTLGVVGIGALIDFIMIIVGSFKDKEGKKLEDWT